MFAQVVVGIHDDHAGRDAIALAMELVSGDGAVTLLHVQVISARPAPDSGAVGAAKYRYAIERLTTLANECAIAARVSCVEAPLATRRAARGHASRQHTDLLVVGASGRDEEGRLLLGDDTREVLEDAHARW